MKPKDENLRELIEKFMDAKKAQMYLDDIEAGERILRNHPAPRPDDMLLANIKANMAFHKVHQRTVSFRKRVIEALAVAASIAIIATIVFRSLQVPPSNGKPPVIASVVPPGWWTLEDEGYVNIINKYEALNDKVEQQIDTYSHNDDSFGIEEFQSQIEQVKDQLVNMETRQDDYANAGSMIEENYSTPNSMIEEMRNKLNEMKNNNFWQDDSSNAGVIDL